MISKLTLCTLQNLTKTPTQGLSLDHTVIQRPCSCSRLLLRSCPHSTRRGLLRLFRRTVETTSRTIGLFVGAIEIEARGCGRARVLCLGMAAGVSVWIGTTERFADIMLYLYLRNVKVSTGLAKDDGTFTYWRIDFLSFAVAIFSASFSHDRPRLSRILDWSSSSRLM